MVCNLNCYCHSFFHNYLNNFIFSTVGLPQLGYEFYLRSSGIEIDLITDRRAHGLVERGNIKMTC